MMHARSGVSPAFLRLNLFLHGGLFHFKPFRLYAAPTRSDMDVKAIRDFPSIMIAVFQARENMMRRRACVIKRYVSAYPDPLFVEAGDVAVVSHCDLAWRGWLWIILPGGKAGWAPQQYFSLRSPNQVICRQTYSAQELTVSPGEQVSVTTSLNDWYWAERASGECGWVPGECIRLLDD